MAELRLNDVRVSFGAVQVLRGISLTVGEGEIVGLAGPNGAGKTTTLRAISGLPERKGEITLDGEPLSGAPDVVARLGVVHVPERRRLFPSLTVLENLRFGAMAVDRDASQPRIDEILTHFPLLRDRLPIQAGLLSGGEQQMVAIARGLMAAPRLLMIDEASLGLSPRAAYDIVTSLVSICRALGMSMLIVDENVRMLGAISDRLYLVNEGRTQEVIDSGEGVDSAVEAVYFNSGKAAGNFMTRGTAD